MSILFGVKWNRFCCLNFNRLAVLSFMLCCIYLLHDVMLVDLDNLVCLLQDKFRAFKSVIEKSAIYHAVLLSLIHLFVSFWMAPCSRLGCNRLCRLHLEVWNLPTFPGFEIDLSPHMWEWFLISLWKADSEIFRF